MARRRRKACGVGWSHGYQSVETVRDLREAREMQRALLTQGRSVLRGVRVLHPSPGKPDFRVQAIWTDDPAWEGQVGMRRVCVPPSVIRTLAKPRRR